MSMIQAQRMAQNVANLLVEHQTWRVHSVFTNGFNLENEAERIFIGTTKNGQLPFAVQITSRDVTKLIAMIQANQTFQYEGGILFTNNPSFKSRSLVPPNTPANVKKQQFSRILLF